MRLRSSSACGGNRSGHTSTSQWEAMAFNPSSGIRRAINTFGRDMGNSQWEFGLGEFTEEAELWTERPKNPSLRSAELAQTRKSTLGMCQAEWKEGGNSASADARGSFPRCHL